MDENKIDEYYDQEIEKDRLHRDDFKLEGIRTKEIIGRYFHTQGLNIVDIGGGAGFYAFWLQSLGHQVSMIDLSQKNIALAHDHSIRQGLKLKVCEVGDATHLTFPDDQFDMALLLGPLYHLTDERDRIQALREVNRVLKPGGILFAAVISRYASLFDGFRRDLIRDDRFEEILMRDLHNGIHKNHTDNPEYFTTAFFHTPEAIKNEILQSGLKLEKIVAVESVGWLVDDLSRKIKTESYWLKVKSIINRVESNDDLMPMSPHILAIARKV